MHETYIPTGHPKYLKINQIETDQAAKKCNKKGETILPF